MKLLRRTCRETIGNREKNYDSRKRYKVDSVGLRLVRGKKNGKPYTDRMEEDRMLKICNDKKQGIIFTNTKRRELSSGLMRKSKVYIRTVIKRLCKQNNPHVKNISKFPFKIYEQTEFILSKYNVHICKLIKDC